MARNRNNQDQDEQNQRRQQEELGREIQNAAGILRRIQALAQIPMRADFVGQFNFGNEAQERQDIDNPDINIAAQIARNFRRLLQERNAAEDIQREAREGLPARMPEEMLPARAQERLARRAVRGVGAQDIPALRRRDAAQGVFFTRSEFSKNKQRFYQEFDKLLLAIKNVNRVKNQVDDMILEIEEVKESLLGQMKVQKIDSKNSDSQKTIENLELKELQKASDKFHSVISDEFLQQLNHIEEIYFEENESNIRRRNRDESVILLTLSEIESLRVKTKECDEFLLENAQDRYKNEHSAALETLETAKSLIKKDPATSSKSRSASLLMKPLDRPLQPNP